MRAFLLIALLLFIVAISPPAYAGGGPENLLLVVNRDSADSGAVAREYQRLRGIHPINIVELSGLPSGPIIKVADFRERILKPILEAITKRGLSGQIDYIIYSAGFPYGVDVSEDMAGKTFPRYITQPASLTGLTFLYELVLARDPDYLTLDANWYARRIKSTVADTPWSDQDRRRQADLVGMHDRTDYKLLAEMETGKIEVLESRAFHHSCGWTRQGQPGATGQLRHYYLSAMLAYTGGPANTLQEALSCLRSAAAADGTRPTGTVYFMVSTDRARTGPREWAFAPAAQALAKLGVKAEVLKGVLPPQKSDVAGAVVGIANFDWRASGSKILPGAFCDHLTSFGGVMTGSGQTMLSEFIRNGAAGASGTVTEPYAIQAKFPNAFLHVHYAGGCSLAEAFYESVTGPYQLLLVGDPLCRPWARIPAVKVSGLKPGETVKGRRSLSVGVSGVLQPGRMELFVDGRRVSASPYGKPITLDTAGLVAGKHELRVVAACGPVEVLNRAIIPFSVGARTR